MPKKPGRPPAPCGTYTAVKRHRRLNEPMCSKCQRFLDSQPRARAKKAREERTEIIFQATKHAEESARAGGESQGRLQALEDLRDTLLSCLKVTAEVEPSKAGGLARELRACLAEIDSIGASDEGDPFGDLLGDDSGNVTRISNAAPRARTG